MASPAVAVVILALAPAPAFAALLAPSCGHANLNNPGRHLGLIKNGCVPGPKVPRPPVPAPKPPNGTVGSLGVIVTRPPALAPVSAIPSAPAAAAMLPPPLLPPLVPALPGSTMDRSLWLVTALLPTLLVIWLLIAARAAIIVVGRRSQKERAAGAS